MKIFNWVHRKFHNKEEKNVEFVVKETESKVPLEHLTLLTIGTFGFHQLSDYADKFERPITFDKLFEQEKLQLEGECYEEEEEEEEEEEYFSDECDEGKEEVNPLVYTTFRSVSNYEDVNGDIKASSEENDDKTRNKMKERTTLADLFSADSEDTMFASSKVGGDLKNRGHDEVYSKKPHQDHDHQNPTMKGLSFAKKLIPKVGKQDTLPIKKLHRMMKKMLKKKIHPDLDGKIQKKENQVIKPAMCGLLADHQGYGLANESASLLQT